MTILLVPGSILPITEDVSSFVRPADFRLNCTANRAVALTPIMIRSSKPVSRWLFDAEHGYLGT